MQPEALSIAVGAAADIAQLRDIVGSRPIRRVGVGGSESPGVMGRWRHVRSLFRRFDSIVVLCIGDDEVVSGHSIYRIVAELLFSKSIVLIGPSMTRVWPGGQGLFTLRRMRELSRIMGTVFVGLSTIAIALVAVAVQEALTRATRGH